MINASYRHGPRYVICFTAREVIELSAFRNSKHTKLLADRYIQPPSNCSVQQHSLRWIDDRLKASTLIGSTTASAAVELGEEVCPFSALIRASLRSLACFRLYVNKAPVNMVSIGSGGH